MPVKLGSGATLGAIVFDGSVTGNLNNPRVAGHVRASDFALSGQHLDSVEADVVAASDNIRVQNAIAAQGALRAQFQGSVGLNQWKTSETSPIAGTATLKDAGMAELAALLHTGNRPSPARSTDRRK